MAANLSSKDINIPGNQNWSSHQLTLSFPKHKFAFYFVKKTLSQNNQA
jgi:hypothetical protein